MEWLSIIIYNLTIVFKIMIKKQSDNQFVMTSFTFYVGFYTDSQTIIKLCHSQTDDSQTMSSNSNPKHDKNTQIIESKELKGSSAVVQLLVIQMWFMDLQHWCYGNANYPATCAPIESEPAFKPGLRWCVWYMKGWKALVYSKFSCMLHFGSLTELRYQMKNIYLHSPWFRGLNTCFFDSIVQCSLWAPSHLTTQRWQRPPLWLLGHLPQGLVLR